jgi:predicted RNA-binding Zn-ribbon protein involved in translation (DUF1610 family)
MDELEHSLPFSEGMIEAEQNAHVDDKRPGRVCLNCGTPLTDKFCPHCGQKDIARRQTIGELAVNFIGSFTSFESKFFKTIFYLLFRPGFLATEYNEGKRERYYHPARAYVFISFIFFLLLLNSNSNNNNNGVNKTLTYETSDSTKKMISFDSMEVIGELSTRARYDSIQQTLPPEKKDNWAEVAIKNKLIDLKLKYRNREGQFWTDIQNGFINSFPKLFFFLLPVFALLLKLLYVRRDFYYSEHLVFAIQFYNFFYLAASIGMLLGYISWLEWIQSFIGIWIFVYLFLGMKKMYRQRWPKTLGKYVLFGGLFSMCILIGFVINSIIVFLFVI